MIYVWHHAAVLIGSLLLSAAVYRREWTRLHPGPAVILWHLILFTTAASLLGLLVSLAVRAFGLGVLPAVGSLEWNRILGLGPGEIAALLTAVAVLAGLAGTQLVSSLHRSRARARHRVLLDVVGDTSRPGLTVIDHHGIAVYTVPGRDPRIVATTGAIGRLSDDELVAVLAHERGHLSGRHDLALFPFFALRRALPRRRFAAALEHELVLLTELCADRRAIRDGYRDPLLRAFAAFTTPRDNCTRPELVTIRRQLAGSPFHPRTATPAALFAIALTLSSTTLSLYILPS